MPFALLYSGFTLLWSTLLELPFSWSANSRVKFYVHCRKQKHNSLWSYQEEIAPCKCILGQLCWSSSPDNRGYSGSTHIYKYSIVDLLFFIFAFKISGQLQVFPCWQSLDCLGYLHPKGTEPLYAGTQIMKWYGSNITCIIMLQFMLKKKGGISSLIAALVSERGLFLPNSFSLKEFICSVIRNTEKPSNENVWKCRQQKCFMKCAVCTHCISPSPRGIQIHGFIHGVNKCFL